MNTQRPIPASMAAKLVLGAAAFAAAAGLAFSAWAAHGPGIFMAMVDAGMSWCF